MHASLRRFTFTAALVACVLSGACSGENPVSTAKPPSAPRLDGATFGSGSASQGTENTTMAADSGSTANRGGRRSVLVVEKVL